MSVTKKYNFLVHYTTWKNGSSEMNYSIVMNCVGKYPTLEDLKTWEKYISDKHSEGYRIDILSFSRMARTERT